MFRALIFDWSGTLVDDSAPTLAATNAVLAAYGKESMAWEKFRESFRLPYSEWYEEHVPGVSLAELEEHFRMAFDSSEYPVVPLEGALEFLEWCSGSGIRLFALTSMNTVNFRKQLAEFGFEDHFEETYSGVLDKRTVISELISRHALNQDDTAYIGDMVHDIETAHAGGLASVGVLSGYDPAAKLEASSPTFLFPCIKSLHAMLKGASSRMTRRSRDQILIRRLAVSCFIGVPEEERAQEQTLHLTVEMTPEREFCELGDNIGRTIDYDSVARRIEELTCERPRQLIETLADEIARMILDEYSAREVLVEVEKDILPATDAVIVRTRQSRGGLSR